MCQNCEKKKKPTKKLNKAKVEIDDNINKQVGSIEIEV